MKLYTFQWSPPTDQPDIEVIEQNAGSAWLKACDMCGCLSDDLILLHSSDVDLVKTDQ